MSKPVRVDPAAEEEIAAGVAWYDAQRRGLGHDFLNEVRVAIRSLARPGPECRPAMREFSLHPRGMREQRSAAPAGRR